MSSVCWFINRRKYLVFVLSLVEKAFYLEKIVPKKNYIPLNAKFYIDYENDMPHPKAFGQIPKLSIFGRLENL